VRDRSIAELWTEYAVPLASPELAGQLPLSEAVFVAGRGEVMVRPSLLQVAAFGRWETEWNSSRRRSTTAIRERRGIP
jgi:hypothetical protein